MSFEVAKCNIVCKMSDTCLYAQSKQSVVYDFRNVCKGESMYLEHFEGDYRETPKKEEVKFEENDTVKCSSDRGQDNVCEHVEEPVGSEG